MIIYIFCMLLFMCVFWYIYSVKKREDDIEIKDAFIILALIGFMISAGFFFGLMSMNRIETKLDTLNTTIEKIRP